MTTSGDVGDESEEATTTGGGEETAGGMEEDVSTTGADSLGANNEGTSTTLGAGDVLGGSKDEQGTTTVGGADVPEGNHDQTTSTTGIINDGGNIETEMTTTQETFPT